MRDDAAKSGPWAEKPEIYPMKRLRMQMRIIGIGTGLSGIPIGVGSIGLIVSPPSALNVSMVLGGAGVWLLLRLWHRAIKRHAEWWFAEILKHKKDEGR